MTLSRLRSLLPARSARPLRRRGSAPAPNKSTDVSVVRLVGYFVGGVLLANLVLMTSAMFRGYAAQSPSAAANLLQKRGPAAAVAAGQAPRVAPADVPATDARATPDVDPIDTAVAVPGKPAITAVCPEAREKLIAGLTHYYLQRGRRPRASAEDIAEAAENLALLAGPADPSVSSPPDPCAG